MSNYAVWNVRLRHVWLQSPLKPQRQKRRARLRGGLQDALDRRAPATSGDSAATDDSSKES